MIFYRQWLPIIFEGHHKNVLSLSRNEDRIKKMVMLMEWESPLPPIAALVSDLYLMRNVFFFAHVEGEGVCVGGTFIVSKMP